VETAAAETAAAETAAATGSDTPMASTTSSVASATPAEPPQEQPRGRTCRFRPCIDLHDGKVKQIVGSTLSDDAAHQVTTNFETDAAPSEFARKYREAGLPGGHVIMLGPGNEEAACDALRAYPGGLQLGGGVTPENAGRYLEAGASHVIVTSYVFREGKIDYGRLRAMRDAVTRRRLVLDLSCRRRPDDPAGPFHVVTDRWLRFTDLALTKESLTALAEYCDEFLVHGVDVEGKRQGIIEELVAMLGEWSPIPVTYAGGVRSVADCDLVRDRGAGRVDVSIGSALDVFGGDLKWDDVVRWHRASVGAGAEREASSGESPPKRARAA